MRAIVAIFGIAWLGDTLTAAHITEVKAAVSSIVEVAPWAFAFALFALSVMVNSQGATTAVLIPLGIAIGLPTHVIIATFVAVNGYFFIPNYGLSLPLLILTVLGQPESVSIFSTIVS